MVFCAGLRPPTVYVSRGAIEHLDAGELSAAMAHEAAHAERRDPERSWVVMGLRSLMVLNPTFQVLARALARDAERLADERGAELGADRLALASAVLKLHRATRGGGGRRTLVFGGALAGPLRRARSLDVEQRARALLVPAPARLPFGRLRLALAGASVTFLLYFVT
jgi:Zn-dependent protease with chaperone function